jgi:hypothetical protein
MNGQYACGCDTRFAPSPWTSVAHGLGGARRTAADEVILRPEPRLVANFGPSHLSEGRISGRYWQCTLYQDILTTVPYAPVAIELARQLLEEPGYDTEDRTLIFLFGREALTVPAPLIDDVLSSSEAFQYWLNAGWVQLRYSAYPYDIGHYAPVVSANVAKTHPQVRFVPLDATTEDESHLLSEVKRWGYMLYHLGIGIAANWKPTVMLTSGTGRWVKHPQFGLLPSGTAYIDLRSWKGDDKTFSESDLKPV